MPRRSPYPDGIRRLHKSGKNLVLHIDPSIAKRVGLEAGSLAQILVKDGELRLVPIEVAFRVKKGGE